MGPRVGLDGRKISSPPGYIYFFLILRAFIPISVHNNYIVILYQPTSTSGGGLLGSEQHAEGTATCVTFGIYV